MLRLACSGAAGPAAQLRLLPELAGWRHRPKRPVCMRAATAAASLLLLASTGLARALEAATPHQLSFWQITDVHMNPDYPSGCGGCKAGTPGKPCGTFADYYCGSSPELYTSAMDFMRSAQGETPAAFAVHTGDFPDVWNRQNDQNHTYFLGNVRFQATQLKKTFRETPVFYALGNHDYPAAPGCPYMPACASHYDAMCQIFSADLDASAMAMCKAHGYYYVDHPKLPGVRVVVLNTEYFNWEGGVDLGDPVDAAAADAHLQWLEQALATAPGKAMIFGHIPPTSSIPASEDGYTGGTMPGHTAPGVQLWWQNHIERYAKIVSSSHKVTCVLYHCPSDLPSTVPITLLC